MLETTTVGSLTLLSARSPQPGSETRPPILFVPGYFAAAWMFETYLPFFAERGYAGYAVNLRGHAGSPLRSGTLLGKVSMTDYIADAREVADWLTDREERPIVIGHSMGGLIAQKLAEEGKARALVLLSPAPPRGIRVMSSRLLRRQLKHVPALLGSRRIVPGWRDMRDLVLNRVPEPEQRATFERFVPDSGRAGREMSLGRIAVNAERVREHRCPVLVVTSDDDRFIPPSVAQRVAARYRAPVFMARAHGHLMLREPGWIEGATFISDWLKREVTTPER
jgi:pimeloyl-ACP methyl ester carboxylesterase